MSNYLTTKEEIIREVKINSDGNEYRYLMLVKESENVASYGIPLYSIRITMTTSDGSTTCSELSDLFSQRGKAEIFFKKLTDNLATPLNLQYIFEDEFMQ